ncbi:MAG: radical SAM protein [Alphaproteobacteria bacterium]|nr:MAG: radical SAM protein [Alphaproteobacteria bacterium]
MSLFDYPLHLNIETVNYCNARCPFCPLFQGSEPLDRQIRPAQVMPADLFEAIVGQIARWPTKPTMTINMDGEPLMDPYFEGRMNALRSAGLAGFAHIETNGHLLTPQKAVVILQAPLGEVRYAFDGATKATYERHRARCDYDRVLANLRMLVALRDELAAPTKILLKYTRTDDNASEVEACYALMNAFMSAEKDTFIDTITHSWARSELEASTLYNVGKVSATKVRADGCSLANSRMVILADGRVPACSLDYNLTISDGGFGNVAASSVLEVWRGAPFERFRDRLRGPCERSPDNCRRCINLYEPPDSYAPAMMTDHSNMIWGGPYNYAYRFTNAHPT